MTIEVIVWLRDDRGSWHHFFRRSLAIAKSHFQQVACGLQPSSNLPLLASLR